jgi:hypothetical protein
MAIMQKEELPDSRNRQAAGTKGRQNEDQIWQRAQPKAGGRVYDKAVRLTSLPLCSISTVPAVSRRASTLFSLTLEWPFLFHPPTSPLVGSTATGVLSSRRGASRAQFSFSGGVVPSEYSTCLFFSLHCSSGQISWFPTLGSAAGWFDWIWELRSLVSYVSLWLLVAAGDSVNG